MLNLTIRDTPKTIMLKLDELLIDKKSIDACCKNVAEVPLKKGIYFWFVPNEAYAKLSIYVAILPIVPVYQKVINGIVHDLVYIGTAGTGKNGNSNLNERLKWHLCTKHSESAVCSGTLSTLRAGLGALLADDLIIPNTEDEVNKFMCHYMKLYWVAYGDNDKDAIDSDESKLIKELRPLLNIKNNPNVAVATSITYTYKQRRVLVYDATKKRLNCNGTVISNADKASRKPVQTTDALHVKTDAKDCQTFVVKVSESIADVASRYPNLITGPCSVSLKDSITGAVVFGGTRNIRTRNRTISQYFNSTDSDSRTAKWRSVQNEMIQRGIKEITVTVCNEDPLNFEIDEIATRKVFQDRKLPKKEDPKKKMEPRQPIQALVDVDIEEIKEKNSNTILVFICSKDKNGNDFVYNGKEIKFYAETNVKRNEFHPDEKIPNRKESWRQLIVASQNDYNLLKAFELYTHPRYKFLNRVFGGKFYILSAGWGLVSSEFRLPKYDITFSQKAESQKKRDAANNASFSDFNALSIHTVNKNDKIVFIGTPGYIDLFIQLTEGLPNERYVWYKKEGVPENYIGINNLFFKRYNTNLNTNWHYELADKICRGLLRAYYTCEPDSN